MATMQLAMVLLIQLAHARRPSSGCGTRIHFPQGQPIEHKLSIQDPNLGEIEREFVLSVPNSANTEDPIPLWMFFHGQGGNALTNARLFDLNALGEEHNFASVFPQGLDDSEGALSLCGTGWNTGAKGDTNTCTSPKADLYSCCYKSCRDLRICSGNFAEAKCGWSTCYDDVAFVSGLIDHIGERMCLDLDEVYISGLSNGGMLTWHLAESLADKISAMLPIFGLPLRGHLNVPPEVSRVPFVFAAGRSDGIVPIDGRESNQGWFYETAADSVAEVAKVHGCNAVPVVITTPFDGRGVNFECVEHLDCKSGGRVLLCLYDGGHAPPATGFLTQFMYWFISETRPNLLGNNTRNKIDAVAEEA